MKHEYALFAHTGKLFETLFYCQASNKFFGVEKRDIVISKTEIKLFCWFIYILLNTNTRQFHKICYRKIFLFPFKSNHRNSNSFLLGLTKKCQ